MNDYVHQTPQCIDNFKRLSAGSSCDDSVYHSPLVPPYNTSPVPRIRRSTREDEQLNYVLKSPQKWDMEYKAEHWRKNTNLSRGLYSSFFAPDSTSKVITTSQRITLGSRLSMSSSRPEECFDERLSSGENIRRHWSDDSDTSPYKMHWRKDRFNNIRRSNIYSTVTKRVIELFGFVGRNIAGSCFGNSSVKNYSYLIRAEDKAKYKKRIYLAREGSELIPPVDDSFAYLPELTMKEEDKKIFEPKYKCTNRREEVCNGGGKATYFTSPKSPRRSGMSPTPARKPNERKSTNTVSTRPSFEDLMAAQPKKISMSLFTKDELDNLFKITRENGDNETFREVTPEFVNHRSPRTSKRTVPEQSKLSYHGKQFCSLLLNHFRPSAPSRKVIRNAN